MQDSIRRHGPARTLTCVWLVILLAGCTGTGTGASASPQSDLPSPSEDQESPEEQEDTFARLVERAEEEMRQADGVLYGRYVLRQNEQDEVFAAFQEDFPFVEEMVYEQGDTNERQQALILQLNSVNPPPLDVFSASTETRQTFEEAGFVVPPPVPWEELAEDLPEGWPEIRVDDPLALKPSGPWIATNARIGVIVYNSNLVSEEEAPKNWDDCLRPEFDGRAIVDPKIIFPQTMTEEFGSWYVDDWAPRYIDMAVPVRGGGAARARIASGEALIWCVSGLNGVIRDINDGAPLAYSVPDPYPWDPGNDLGVASHSQSPHTAQLFMAWFATKGQEVMTQYAYALPWAGGGLLGELMESGTPIGCYEECEDNLEANSQKWTEMVGE